MNGSLVIVERELPGLLRTRQALWVLFFVAFSFAVTVYLKWPSSATADLAGVQAGQAFRGLAYAMLLAVLLVVPAFPATGLIREVRRGTMELLLNSPLRRTEIYFGKLLALMGFAVLLLVALVPPSPVRAEIGLDLTYVETASPAWQRSCASPPRSGPPALRRPRPRPRRQPRPRPGASAAPW